MGKWMVAALVVVAMAVQVEATFASSAGFSGRNVDCTVCHAPAGVTATAHLDDVPQAWLPGQTYTVSARVTGGPLALPSPQPQGGFELEAEAGRVDAGPGMGGLLRFPSPTIATYEPEGTLRRDWSITWTAPPAHEPPAEVTLWLAVLAANGNHVIATNTSDGGEQGDAVATVAVTIPPAPEAVAAWVVLPLEPPVVERLEEASGGVRIIGHHDDANATHLAYRVGDGPWVPVADPGDWRLLVAGDVGLVAIRSEGHGRVSPPVSVAPPGQATPALGGLLLVALLVAARVK